MRILCLLLSSFAAMLFIALPCMSEHSVHAATTEYGDYIKGESFPDVYVIDYNDNGTLVRKPFINEQIYFTWQDDFDNVRTIADKDLAAIPLGPPVLPQSGVVLVKIQSVVKVYVVEGDTLRWITNEDVARELYGVNWDDYVIDLPPTIYPYFSQGMPIENGATMPDRSIMKTRAELIAQTEGARNPLIAWSFYIDPDSAARSQVDAWSAARPNDATALERIASQATARWFGDWNTDVFTAVQGYVTRAVANGTMPVLVAYNIPNRDCNGLSSGGATDAAAYRSWMTAFAGGIAEHPALVILEPDALAADCVTDARLSLIGEAVATLKALPNTVVYVDAGHAQWIDAATMATRLIAANIATANGFALNVANFYTTEENATYGSALSQHVGNKHFVIDTSRNGNGSNGEWCNPPGRLLGSNPTTATGNSLIDAFLWIKPPGESDGTCNGGPSAGTWWAEYALELVR